jgi:hypothetical protein
MGTTPNLALRYPSSSSAVTPYQHIQDLASDVDAAVALGYNAISNPAVTSGSDTTVSAVFVNMAGTGAVTSFVFNKKLAATKVVVTMFVGWQNAVALSQMSFGVLVNGVDYECTRSSQNATNTPALSSGFAVISGLAVGAYTVQARWKRRGGSGTPTRSNDEILAMIAEEKFFF